MKRLGLKVKGMESIEGNRRQTMLPRKLLNSLCGLKRIVKKKAIETKTPKLEKMLQEASSDTKICEKIVKTDPKAQKMAKISGSQVKFLPELLKTILQNKFKSM